MKPKITIVYRKVTNRNLPISQYWPRGSGGKGKPEVIKSAVIKLDPILKKDKNKKLIKIILKHETDEISARNKGATLKKAHKIAMSKEPKWFTKEYPNNRLLQKKLREEF